MFYRAIQQFKYLFSLEDIKGVGCMDVVEALVPCLKMKPKYSCQFSISKKYFILQNINQSKNIYCI
jgi:hypothetical protein